MSGSNQNDKQIFDPYAPAQSLSSASNSAANTASTSDIQKNANSFDWRNAEKVEYGIGDRIKDGAVTALNAAISIPEAAIGISDMMNGGKTSKLLRNTVGIDTKAAREVTHDWKSDAAKARDTGFDVSDGIVDKAAYALSNPSMIAEAVAESVPSMLLGGGITKATGIANKALGAALGEGAVMAGSQAANIRDETKDGTLTADQSALSAGTGVLGSLFGYAGNKIAGKLGIEDVDNVVAKAVAGEKQTVQAVANEIASIPPKSVPNAFIRGAFAEGVLEELPQSVSEQILQNIALDKHWDEGLDAAIVMGTLSGAAMGGVGSAYNAYGEGRTYRDAKKAMEQQGMSSEQAEQQLLLGAPKGELPNFNGATADAAQFSQQQDGGAQWQQNGEWENGFGNATEQSQWAENPNQPRMANPNWRTYTDPTTGTQERATVYGVNPNDSNTTIVGFADGSVGTVPNENLSPWGDAAGTDITTQPFDFNDPTGTSQNPQNPAPNDDGGSGNALVLPHHNTPLTNAAISGNERGVNTSVMDVQQEAAAMPSTGSLGDAANIAVAQENAAVREMNYMARGALAAQQRQQAQEQAALPNLQQAQVQEQQAQVQEQQAQVQEPKSNVSGLINVAQRMKLAKENKFGDAEQASSDTAIEATRNDAGKLDPFHENSFVRIRATEEMNLDEKLAHNAEMAKRAGDEDGSQLEARDLSTLKTYYDKQSPKGDELADAVRAGKKAIEIFEAQRDSEFSKSYAFSDKLINKKINEVEQRLVKLGAIDSVTNFDESAPVNELVPVEYKVGAAGKERTESGYVQQSQLDNTDFQKIRLYKADGTPNPTRTLVGKQQIRTLAGEATEKGVAYNRPKPTRNKSLSNVIGSMAGITSDGKPLNKRPEGTDAPKRDYGHFANDDYPAVVMDAGKEFTTSSGNQTTPFPKINQGGNVVHNNGKRKSNQWLFENAMNEADARGDKMMFRDFQDTLKNRDLKKLSHVYVDEAYDYLFGANAQASTQQQSEPSRSSFDDKFAFGFVGDNAAAGASAVKQALKDKITKKDTNNEQATNVDDGASADQIFDEPLQREPTQDNRNVEQGDTRGSSGRTGDGNQRSTTALDESGDSGVTGSEPSDTGTATESGRDTQRELEAEQVFKEPETSAESIEQAIVEAEAPLSNHVIDDADEIGVGNDEQKFNDNIAAIELVNKLDAENRNATDAERKVLARYVGWGGLSKAFEVDGTFPKGWEARGKRLKSLLSEADYENAADSTTSAFYTAPQVVKSMWAMAEKLGFKGGMVLEPSVGTGNFLGMAPKLPIKTIAVEYDGITSRIAQHLYPQAKVFHSGYEKMAFNDNTFDLTIGNPPYGSRSLNFAAKPHLNKGMTIHNQFMLSTIENLKPEGISIMVVSHSFMDARDSTTREAIAKQADLIGAIRLPASAFKGSAGTEVITDILVFKKTEFNTNEDAPAWVKSESYKSHSFPFNPYFNEDGRMAGEFAITSGQFGETYTVNGSVADMQAALDKFTKSLPKIVEAYSPAELKIINDKAFNSVIEHLEAALSNVEIGSVSMNKAGQLQRVLEVETYNGTKLVTQVLSPKTVWSEKYTLSDDGRYFTKETVIGDDGKPVKQLNADGEPTNLNVKERVYVNEDDINAQSRLGVKGYGILKAVSVLRDTLRAQFHAELNDAPDMESNRTLLKQQYDKFVKDHGYINENSKYISMLPDAALLYSLEASFEPAVKDVVGTDSKGKNKYAVVRKASAKPNDILTKRVISKPSKVDKANTPIDALTLSLAYTGGVDSELMGKLLSTKPEQVIAELQTGDKPLVFFDPVENKLVTAQQYLSGNVRQKLNDAREANLDMNVQALEKVTPEEVTLDNITLSLGQHWIPAKVYGDFMTHITDDAQPKVSYEPTSGLFTVEASHSTAKGMLFGTPKAAPSWIAEQIMNNKSIKITKRVYVGGDEKTLVDVEATEAAIAMADAIKMEFADWIYGQSEIAQGLKNLFNERYNAMVPEKYDGSHLQFVGKVPDSVIELRTHQKNAIWRGMTNQFVLYDHAVGSGKTFTGIARAMERRALGLSKKPVIVVPNHMIEQFSSDVYRLYPNAKVLAAGQADFQTAKRKKLFARIATGDYDIIVIAHSSFEFIKLSDETESRFMEEELDKIMAAISEVERNKNASRWTIKRLKDTEARIRKRLEAKRESKRKDGFMTFEELGIDDITIDEAHEFKNLFYNTNLSGVVGLGNASGSNKAFDLFNKFKYLHSIGGSGAFMTGTPISNSAVEMHVMMRYLMPDVLQNMGLENFDNWAKLFADNASKFEFNEAGKLVQKTRFARDWKNMRALMNLWYTVADPVTNSDVKRDYKERTGREFPLPKVKNGGRTAIAVELSDAQAELLDSVIHGFSTLNQIADPKERAAERFRLMDRARKLSLDPRALNPVKYANDSGNKLRRVANEAYLTYKQWDAEKGTQIIFLDRSIPSSTSSNKEVDAYEKLIAEREAAELDGDFDAMVRVQDKLEKYDTNEMNELLLAKNGGWNAYRELTERMIEAGIPAEQIANIYEANDDDKKRQLFDKVNRGEVRVIIGSTSKMGAGTNIQKRLVRLHHVDVTWKPSDIEQREGRIIRQGNELMAETMAKGKPFEVEISAYVTERTMDAKLWDVNSAKFNMIEGIRNYNGDFNMDFGEDADSISMDEIAALASGDPLMLERVTLDAEIQQLQKAKQRHIRKNSAIRQQLAESKRIIERTPTDIESLKPAVKLADKARADIDAATAAQSVMLDGKTFSSRDDANQHIADKVAEFKKKSTEEKTFKAQFEIDGELVSASATLDYVVKAFPALNTNFEIDGTQYFSMEPFRKANGDKAPSWANGISNGPVMQVYGLDTFAEIVDGEVFITAKTPDGQLEVGEAKFKNGADFQASDFFRAIRELAKKVTGAVTKLAINFKANEIKRAEATIEELGDKLNDRFPQEDELLAKQERLEDVQDALKQTDNQSDTDTSEARNSRADGNPMGGMSAKAARAILIERFGGKVIAKLEKQGKLRIINNQVGMDGIEGYYVGGQVTLIANNLNSASVIATFIHELGGHAGFQGIMSDSKYQQLRSQFDRMVANKNPVALEALRLAEREFGSAARDLEMLPYLLTVASTVQTTNAIHKGTVSRMIQSLTANVKAFAFDKLGVNLNLNERDMLALANRMIVEATNPNVTLQSQYSDKLYSRMNNLADIGKTIKDAYFGDSYGHKSFWHKSLGTMSNLAERDPFFKPVFNLAQKFIDDVAAFASRASDLAPTLIPQMGTFRDVLTKYAITKADNNAIAKPIFEGTLVYGRDKNGNVVDTSKIASTVAGIVWTDSELRSRYKLNDQQISLYREFRAAVDESLSNLTKSEMLRVGGKDLEPFAELIMSSKDLASAHAIISQKLNTIAKASPNRARTMRSNLSTIGKIYGTAEGLINRGYAPLSRFGDIAVEVRNVATGEVVHFSLFDGRTAKYDAQKRLREMEAIYSDKTKYSVTRSTMSKDKYKLFKGVSPETMELFADAIGLNGTGTNSGDKVFQDYIRMARANRSASKRMLTRKGTEGYSEDVTRVLASFLHSNARATSSNLNLGKLERNINAIPKEQGELSDIAVQLRDHVVDPDTEGGPVSYLRSVMFAQFLGGSVASALVNLTQPFAVTAPYLTQFTSVADAGVQITKAFEEFTPLSIDGARSYDKIVGKFTPQLQTAIKRAEADGTLSPQEIFHLMEQASGKGGLAQRDGTLVGDNLARAQNGFKKFSVVWGRMFAQAEQMNRRVTFVAAYRIAIDKGIPDPEAFARKVVTDTQFNYSKAAKMKWGRNPISALLLTFKTYMVSYLELMHRLWTNNGKTGVFTLEWHEGRKAALLMLAMLFLMGGVGGEPFMEDIEDLLDGILQRMGYNVSVADNRKQFINDIFGKSLGGFVNDGVSQFLPIDISGRLGMGNLIPATGAFKQRDDYMRDTLEFLGPAADFIKRGATSANALSHGDINGLFEVLPTAMRNAIKGVEMGTTGEYRDTKGNKVVDAGIGDAAIKAIGFQPRGVAKVQEANYTQQGFKAFYNSTAQEIRAEWARGIYEKDSAKVEAARKRLQEWNEKNPDMTMVIRMTDIMRRVRNMRKSKSEKIADSAPKSMRENMRSRMREELEEADNDL